MLAIMSEHLDHGYCLTEDNFYCFPEVVDTLVSRKTDAYGTVCTQDKECHLQCPSNSGKERSLHFNVGSVWHFNGTIKDVHAFLALFLWQQ